jgi:hypothetical protein
MSVLGPVLGLPGRQGGEPGRKGDNGGNPGKDGTAGTNEIPQGSAGATLLGAVSVTQLAMMADRVRASYFSLDPETDDYARADVLDRMEWLSRLLERIPPEHSHYPVARAAVLEVTHAKDAIKGGLDWFGNGPGYVPSVSVGRLNEDVIRQLKVLRDLEELNDKYVQALIQQQGTTTTIQRALSMGDNQLDAVAAEFASTRADLDKAAERIRQADADRKAARKPLEAALINFNTKVQESFGVSAETIFNALSQLAFTSPENPAGAAMMGVSQAGTIVNEGMRNILDDSGRPIDKGYVLGEVRRFSSPDISSDLKQLADGQFSNEPTYRALTEYNKVKQCIQRFANSTVGAQDAIDQINNFIDLVVARNHHVDYSNFLLRNLIDINTRQRRLTLRQQISRDSFPSGPVPRPGCRFFLRAARKRQTRLPQGSLSAVSCPKLLVARAAEWVSQPAGREPDRGALRSARRRRRPTLEQPQRQPRPDPPHAQPLSPEG